jgi:hypothetical protein
MIGCEMSEVILINRMSITMGRQVVDVDARWRLWACHNRVWPATIRLLILFVHFDIRRLLFRRPVGLFASVPAVH